MAIEKNKRTEHKVTEFVTGYSQFPEAGGVLDQSNWLMEIFDHFRSGENANAVKALK